LPGEIYLEQTDLDNLKEVIRPGLRLEIRADS